MRCLARADAASNLKTEKRRRDGFARSPLFVTTRRIRVFTASQRSEENCRKEEAVSSTRGAFLYRMRARLAPAYAARTAALVRSCATRILNTTATTAYRVSSSAMFNALDFLPSRKPAAANVPRRNRYADYARSGRGIVLVEI